VRERLEQLGWRVAALEVLPDEADLISARLATLADGNQLSAVFTTGGTGVAPRDITPEATQTVIERLIPGLAECMRMDGRKSTPTAVLSRGIAGTRGKVLIVNLPGSPKGAVESLNSIVDLVPHILDLLGGNTTHPAATQLNSVL
jgi:molybdenum cofactor synthesis domain-containing protein